MFYHKSRGYGSFPRSSDRARTYSYLKHGLAGLFRFRFTDRLEDTLRVVTLAAMNNAYVEGTAANLGLCGQTIRNRLRQQDPSIFFQANKGLIGRMRSMGAFSRPVPLAIDTHDEMFYGDPASDGVVGTQRRRGASYAYRFATASVLTDGQRVTVAVVPLTTGPVVDHVRRLMEQVLSLGIGVKYALLDRGYYSADLIRYLQSAGIGFIIHVLAHTHLEAGQGRLYTSKSHRKRKGEQVTFRLATMIEGDELYAFATNLGLAPKGIRSAFRKRWGIGTAYRMIRMFLPKTTSKAYRTRVLYFFTAVLLYNLWVFMNFRKGMRMRKGKGDEKHTIVEAVKLEVALFILAAAEARGDDG